MLKGEQNMLKKLERRIKEKLERLSDKDIGSIKDLISFIKVAYELCYMACFTFLLGTGVFLIFIMVETGYTRVTTVIIPIVSLAILFIINAYAKKVDKICDEVMLDRNIDPEIKKLQDNLSKDEYTKIIRIEKRWEIYIKALKGFMEWLENPEMEYNAKLVENNNIEVMVKNKDGECKDRTILDCSAFLEFYEIPDTECK